jgi:coenzyme Q-binding protein COQ10
MIRITRQKQVPFDNEEMFDLVNDTESYAGFVPYCQKSTIKSVVGDEKYCELIFSKGPVSRSLITRNKLILKDRIEIYLHQGDFKHLKGIWTFEKNKLGCLITVSFEYEFSNSMMEFVLGPLFQTMTEQMVEIFSTRADDVLR